MPESRSRPGGGRDPGANPVRRNRLLELVPDEEMERIRPRLEEREIAFREVLYRDGEPSAYAYFPLAGVFSMVSSPQEQNGLIVEVATIGNEGMVGLPLLLGGGNTPGECFCQVPGRAARIAAAPFQRLVDDCPQFRRILLRYTQSLITQIAQNAACNRMHPVEERCARWLLMTHDRVGVERFEMTQEFLAQMLGVRRPTVTVAAGMLQKAGLISYTRGAITVTDRKGLEAASCDCYAIIREEFLRLTR